MLDQPTDPQQEEKHSPLPWYVVHGVCRNDHPDTSADVRGRHGQFVANCGCHGHANADAELIVDAVNNFQQLRERHEALTAALKELAEYAEHTPDCRIDAWKHYDLTNRPRPDCNCGLDAALAKAGA